MAGACNTQGTEKKRVYSFNWKIVLEKQTVDGRIILKWISNKEGGTALTEFL
jgi:hypothetical protein